MCAQLDTNTPQWHRSRSPPPPSPHLPGQHCPAQAATPSGAGHSFWCPTQAAEPGFGSVSWGLPRCASLVGHLAAMSGGACPAGARSAPQVPFLLRTQGLIGVSGIEQCTHFSHLLRLACNVTKLPLGTQRIVIVQSHKLKATPKRLLGRV